MNEIWKPVLGFESLYLISNLGRVMGLTSHKIRKPTLHKQGYVRIQLRKNNIPHNILVHRLVAEAFIGPPPSDRYTINHKDGNKANNCVDNLEWCTQGDNNRHAFRVLKTRDMKGQHNANSKLTETDVRRIRQLRRQGMMYVDIARIYNMDITHISLVARGKLWKHIRD